MKKEKMKFVTPEKNNKRNSHQTNEIIFQYDFSWLHCEIRTTIDGLCVHVEWMFAATNNEFLDEKKKSKKTNVVRLIDKDISSFANVYATN